MTHSPQTHPVSEEGPDDFDIGQHVERTLLADVTRYEHRLFVSRAELDAAAAGNPTGLAPFLRNIELFDAQLTIATHLRKLRARPRRHIPPALFPTLAAQETFMDPQDTLTIICAYDNAETHTVRRALGIATNQILEAADAERLAGVCVLDLHIVETPRFLQRPDAGSIRKVLHAVSQVCRNVTRATHDGEGQPAPHLRGGPQTLLNGAVVAQGSNSREAAFTRETLRELLDSQKPEEAAATVHEHMHLGFGDHPVVKEIIQRRYAALEAYLTRDEGEAAEQSISEEDAHALVAHIAATRERLASRPHLTVRLPPLPEQVVPGQYLATIYGVRIVVANPAPVITEQHGNPAEHATYQELVDRSVPTGTRPHKIGQYLIPNMDNDEPARQHAEKLAKRHVAEQLAEPHVLILLRRGDLPFGQWPLPEEPGAGVVLVLGVTVRALPGVIPSIVLRPAPGLPLRWLGKEEGRWRDRPPYSDELMLAYQRDLFEDVQMAHARPTGRIEVNASGAMAEVWEVS
ncbi:hypothetical protein ACIBKY_03635 [Nonomuraea sp. NPDC050394]|uniref:hypothetical protein n=1 Tax=Nonomuraea sp. NPDC050394 TaxID=3364363 RepID=UPI003799228E